MLKAYQVVMFVAVLVLGALCLEQRVRLAHPPAAAAPAPAKERTASIAAAREAALVAAAVPAPPPMPEQPGATNEATDKAQAPDVVTDLLNNPDNLETIRSFSSPELDSLYAPLFRALGLSTDDIEQFKDLVTAKKIAQAELRIRETEAATEEEQRVVQEQRERAMKWFDDRIRDLLGAGSYAMLEGYDKSLAERTMLFDFKQGLENVGQGLTYDQEDRLIRLMYDERTRTPSINALFSASDALLSEIAEPKQLVEAFDAWRASVIRQGREVLSEEQLAALDRKLGDQSAALRNFLEVK